MTGPTLEQAWKGLGNRVLVLLYIVNIFLGGKSREFAFPKIQSGPEMSSILRISDGFSAEFLGSCSHSQKVNRAFSGSTPLRGARKHFGSPGIRARGLVEPVSIRV